MKIRFAGLALVMALLFSLVVVPFSASATASEAKSLKNLPVAGAVSDGGWFKGKVTITEVGYDELKGFTVSGFVHGTVFTADGQELEDVEQHFSNVPATLVEPTSVPGFSAQATCEILDLDIGAISLDLLGLQLDLSPIALDLTAVSGAGNLLGNLLCAVAGLLDPNGLLDPLIGTLEDLLGLLDQINNLLG